MIFRLNTPIHLFENIGSFQLFIKREDRSFASFGTKIRKFQGLLNFLRENYFKNVIISGSPHSNFVSAFTYLLHSMKFSVYSILTTRDKKLETGRSILSRRFSNEIVHLDSGTDTFAEMNRILDKSSGTFLVPEFGLHESCFEGLESLWAEIESARIHYDYVFLDLGSGLTFLSGLRFFPSPERTFVGISIGTSEEKMNSEIISLSQKLEFEFPADSNYRILPPSIVPKFGKSSEKLNQWIRTIWLRKNIPLEPVYSGKSLYTICQYISQKRLKGKGLYIHQGGLLGHTGAFLEKK